MKIKIKIMASDARNVMGQRAVLEAITLFRIFIVHDYHLENFVVIKQA